MKGRLCQTNRDLYIFQIYALLVVGRLLTLHFSLDLYILSHGRSFPK